MDFYELLLAEKLNGGGGGGSGQWTTNGIAQGLEPSGDIVYNGTTLSDFAFAGKPITSFTAPNLVSSNNDGNWWFPKCSLLKTISLPLAVRFSINMNNNAYGTIPLLEKLYIPSVTTLGGQSLTQMPKLKAVALPSIQTISANGLQTPGSGIETVDFGKNLNSIENYNAPNNNTLVNIILRKDDGIVPCTNVGGLASRLVNYYIPKALFDHLGDGTSLDYQSASNWVTRYNSGYCNFVQIEGTQFENYYADGTPIN